MKEKILEHIIKEQAKKIQRQQLVMQEQREQLNFILERKPIYKLFF